jgi:15-cis-phytoene synthase
MTDYSETILSPAAELALAWSPADVRPMLRNALSLDHRLAQIIAHTSEPMLGQMRLAWWREALRKEPGVRPQGDAVLDAISRCWIHPAEALIFMIDGWEELLGRDALDEATAHKYAHGRAHALLVACEIAADDEGHEAARSAGLAWAFGDLASKVSSAAERAMLTEQGLVFGAVHRALPVRGRGLAVLGALGRRGLRRGGRPLMEGRSAALVALSAAITRR